MRLSDHDVPWLLAFDIRDDFPGSHQAEIRVSLLFAVVDKLAFQVDHKLTQSAVDVAFAGRWQQSISYKPELLMLVKIFFS